MDTRHSLNLHFIDRLLSFPALIVMVALLLVGIGACQAFETFAGQPLAQLSAKVEGVR